MSSSDLPFNLYLGHKIFQILNSDTETSAGNKCMTKMNCVMHRLECMLMPWLGESWAT